MTSFRDRTQNNLINIAPTGELERQFFEGATQWATSSTSADFSKRTTYESLVKDAVGNAQLRSDSQTLDDTTEDLLRKDFEDLSQELEQIRKELDAFKHALTLSRDLLSSLETLDGNDDDDEPFEQWLSQWQEESPNAFTSHDEVSQIIHQYEEKYGMSSQEMLKRDQEGTNPDEFEFSDWKVLLELVSSE